MSGEWREWEDNIWEKEQMFREWWGKGGEEARDCGGGLTV